MDHAESLSFLTRLGLRTDADERAIRRAYARELKQIDQEADPESFQTLREAYDTALQWARQRDDDTVQVSAPALDIVAPPAEDPIAEPSGGVDENELVDALFTQFHDHCRTLADGDTSSPHPWRQAIHYALNDPRLFSIAAREGFERRIAILLAGGWQPGHEALLPAATEMFGWSVDRRRLQRFGYPGFVLDTAIDEREIFDRQPDEVRYEQGRVIARLRDASLPDTHQLVADAPRINIVEARYPHWLAIVTSATNINRWREAVEALPLWRRKMASLGLRRASDDPRASSKFSALWTVIIGFMLIMRLASCGHDAVAPKASIPPPPLETAAEHIERGTKALGHGEYNNAINHFGRASQLDPQNASPHAWRAIAYAWNNQLDLAQTELDLSAELNGANALLFRARGVVANKRGLYADAIDAYTRSRQLEPEHPFTMMQRAVAYANHGDYDQAVAEADHLLKLDPNYGIGPYRLPLQVAVQRDRRDEAYKRAEAMLAALPDNSDAYASAARAYLNFGQRQDAIAVLTRGVVAAPDADLYLLRAQLKDRQDRRADLTSALALAPQSVQAINAMADLELDEGNASAAASLLSKALNDAKLDDELRAAVLVMRGIAYTRSGADTLARGDYEHARKLAVTATDLNNLCWRLVTRNTSLSTALSLCDAALQADPVYAAALDSRGLVLLRMGRYRDAINAYDAAIRKQTYAASLFGRGLAKRKLGDLTGGDADLRAARAKAPLVDRDFSEMGIKPD
ncbi:tetratricopeptide repeat protein [Duganella sp. FT80W]|uniref:Tetratricopeptide repeat protein n=1 Tax=Duganella guangzhouensis TaxID=2666084 RepID=A0A6I2KYU1_9BURK|nr:tetratricopeptide repeat protein [Duganella guangzhouensis]MRW90672.1 tetratricopeptide repeat protein [Duganella guangzhouensis]